MRLRTLFCATACICGLGLPVFAFAATMGSLAAHDADTSENGQATEQWIDDPHSGCVAADPNYQPGDSISWLGRCRQNGTIYGRGTLNFLYRGQVIETITGSFLDGLLQPGHVEATWSDGAKYEGDQVGGLFDGRGKFVSAKGDILDGEWKMGVLNGTATVIWANGDRYDGMWKNGKSDGHGVETWADGRRFEGDWRDGTPLSGLQPSGAAVNVAAAPQNPGATPAGALAVTLPQTAAQSAAQLASITPSAPAPLPPGTAKAAVAGTEGNDAPALPLRTHLGTQLVAVDGATLELLLSEGGFERTLVLPSGSSQQIDFAFANGPVGTVSDGETAIGVFRAETGRLDIDYADGTTESIGEATNGGLVDRARATDGRLMCTTWYPRGHVFSQSEKQAAVQEYATRLGLSFPTPSAKHKSHDSASGCGGGFIASGNTQKAASVLDDERASPPAPQPRASGQSAQPAEGGRSLHAGAPEGGVISVRTSPIHAIDTPGSEPAHLEEASFSPGSLQVTGQLHTEPNTTPPQSGASDCLTVTSNGEYWGFQNRCAKSVQFSYCEMSDANPLTSCNHTSVAGSVAANSFSALVSDRSLAEKNAEHEFRWMACDGGAGEVVPHLDKIDPPSGRCERAVAPAE